MPPSPEQKIEEKEKLATSSGATLRVEYKTMLRSERAKDFVHSFVPPLVTVWGTLVANDVANRISIQVLEPTLLRCTSRLPHVSAGFKSGGHRTPGCATHAGHNNVSEFTGCNLSDGKLSVTVYKCD